METRSWLLCHHLLREDIRLIPPGCRISYFPQCNQEYCLECLFFGAPLIAGLSNLAYFRGIYMKRSGRNGSNSKVQCHPLPRQHAHLIPPGWRKSYFPQCNQDYRPECPFFWGRIYCRSAGPWAGPHIFGKHLCERKWKILQFSYNGVLSGKLGEPLIASPSISGYCVQACTIVELVGQPCNGYH